MSKILIYGYGAEGQSTEAFFRSQSGTEITIFDAKSHPETPKWDNIDQIFLSPGIDPKKVPAKHQDKITNQANWFLETITPEQRKKVIGITGSKGKTTTTLMTTAWLESQGFKVACAGNIGHPILEIYNDFINGDLDFVVLEVSSFQAEIMKYSPEISLFLGLFSDHLDRHGNLKNYGAAKSHLWAFQSSQGAVITTPQGLETVEAHPGQGQVLVSQALEADFIPEDHVFQAEHFRENLGTIKVLSQVLEKPFQVEEFQKVVAALSMPEHRLEFIAEKQGIKFYNDAIASNPEAVVAAVKFFGPKLGTLILGGTDSGGRFEELIQTIQKNAPQTQIIITKSPILPHVESAIANKSSLTYTVVNTLNEAVEEAFKLTPPKKACLLSPGGKSFDQYPNYVTKGLHFKELVTSF